MSSKFLSFLFIIFFIFKISFSQDTIISVPENDTLKILQEELNYKLILAADSGNANRVLELLKKGADVNSKTYDEISALMYASQNGNYEAVRVLVANGADVNLTPQSGETSLIAAVKSNHENVVQYLLMRNADPSISDNNGKTALHYTAAYNYYVLTDMLLFYKANIEEKTNAGYTPLMIASFYGNYSTAKLLIEKGADVNAADKYAFTPLMLASQVGDYDIVKLLVENNAEINKINDKKSTALSLAIRNGHSEIVYFLLDNDADIKPKDKYHDDPYKLAIASNQSEIVDTLIKKGVKNKFLPYFNKLFFSYGFNFNQKNFMFETKLGIIDSKFKLSFDIGIANNYWAKRVLVKQSDNVYEQLWERRSFLFIDAEKRFNISAKLENQNGIFVGTRGIYTYGNYRGINTKIDDKFLIVPQIGFYTMNNYVAAKINYEYIDFKVEGIPKHRVNFSFIVFLNIKNQQNANSYISF